MGAKESRESSSSSSMNENKEGIENNVAGLAETVVVLALAAYGVSDVIGSCLSQRKTMNAPGRDFRFFWG